MKQIGQLCAILIILYLVVAPAVFAIRHPKMNEMTQFLHFFDMLTFNTIKGFQ